MEALEAMSGRNWPAKSFMILGKPTRTGWSILLRMDHEDLAVPDASRIMLNFLYASWCCSRTSALAYSRDTVCKASAASWRFGVFSRIALARAFWAVARLESNAQNSLR